MGKFTAIGDSEDGYFDHKPLMKGQRSGTSSNYFSPATGMKDHLAET